MTKNIFFPLLSDDYTTNRSSVSVTQPIIHEREPVISVPQQQEQKPSSSYLTLSVGDTRCSDLSNFQDPLFYQQSLRFHYHQTIPSTMATGYETGDRIAANNEIKFNQRRHRRKSESSRIDRTGKGEIISRRCKNGKMKKKLPTKTNERKTKTSTRTMNKRKHKSEKTIRSGIQQLRHQSKARREVRVKDNRHRKMLSQQKKKKRLKQHLTTQKRSILNVNKHNSVATAQRSQKLHMKNRRAASTTSTCRSNGPRLTNSRSVIQPKTTTNSQPPLSSKISSASFLTTKLQQQVCGKNLHRSKSHARRSVTSTSKELTQQNGGDTKLNIYSPVHTTFNTNVRCYRKKGSTQRKRPFSRCTSNARITIAPVEMNDEDMTNDDIHTKKSSPSKLSLKNSFAKKLSSISTLMPLAKTGAQLTSKNNNERAMKMKRQRLKHKLVERGRRGMTLRSRTIIIDSDISSKRRGMKSK